MNIKSFNKQNLKTLRQEIDAALATVSKKNGINLSIGNITFTQDGTKFTTRITALTKTQTKSQTQTASQTPRIFSDNGFEIGSTFRLKTKILTIKGYNARRPKNCVELEDQNGKKFSASLQMVTNQFK